MSRGHQTITGQQDLNLNSRCAMCAFERLSFGKSDRREKVDTGFSFGFGFGGWLRNHQPKTCSRTIKTVPTTTTETIFRFPKNN